MASISCLIPFYNEGNQILKVLDVISKVNGIDQIVAVDDGSTDLAFLKIQSRFPKVRLVRHQKNQGKTAAVKTALKEINSDFTLLCDADLRSLKVSEIQAVVTAINNKLDMVILRNFKPNPNYSLVNRFRLIRRISFILSGQRILKTQDLSMAIKEFDSNGYQLETAVNQYMIDHNKKVKWLSYSATNNYKIKELGLRRVIFKYLKMTYHILSCIGLKNCRRQLNNFCLKEAS